MNSPGIDGIAGILVILFIVLIPAILWIWALVDIIRSDFADSTNKIVWILAIIFLPVIGALLYLLIGRRQKLKA
ncbi:MAG: hypothetical protein Roseis2KO_57080 [Roseivirga sp.]